MLWRQTLVDAPIGMAVLDLDGRCVESNNTLSDQVGYPREDLIGRRCTDLIYDGYTEPAETLFADLRESRTDSGSLELCLRHREGFPFWMLVRIAAVKGADNRPACLISQYETLCADMKVSRERLSELTRMALHDPLTDLANRTLLTDRFRQALARLTEHGGALVLQR
jgi:PAS domain S-box-containing protein